jgi:hypothetical protein
MQVKTNQADRCQPSQQDADNRLEWIDHPFERSGVELRNILRWEDDGGLMEEVDGSSVILSSNYMSLVHEYHP